MQRKVILLLALSCMTLLLTQCGLDDLDSLEPLSMEEQDTQFLPANASRNNRQIPGRYIVVLNNEQIDVSDIEKIREIAKGLARKNGVNKDSIKQVYGKALKGFSIGLNRGQLKKLEKEGVIDYIIPDRVVQLAPPRERGPKKKNNTTNDNTSSSQTIPWGVTKVGGVSNGVGKTVWVLDSGVDLDHPDLNVDVTNAWSGFGGRDRSPDDSNGHGTHVAGIIGAKDNGFGVVGVAAGATIVPVKVLNSRGLGSYSVILAGIDYVTRKGKPGDVANLSLGGVVDAIVDNAVINAAASSGMHFVLAAGNEAIDCSGVSPARANGPGVYTISAMDSANRFASFSNYGSSVDYCAPGVNILSTYPGGGYAIMDGTSMAAPHASAVLLLGTATTNGVVSGDPDGQPDPIISR